MGRQKLFINGLFFFCFSEGLLIFLCCKCLWIWQNGLEMIPYWSILDLCVICIILNVCGTGFVHFKKLFHPIWRKLVLATSCFPLFTRDCELSDLLLFKTDWDQSEVFTVNFDVILAGSGSPAAGRPARSIIQKWSRKGVFETKASSWNILFSFEIDFRHSRIQVVFQKSVPKLKPCMSLKALNWIPTGIKSKLLQKWWHCSTIFPTQVCQKDNNYVPKFIQLQFLAEHLHRFLLKSFPFC